MARKKTTVYMDEDMRRLAKAKAAMQGKTLGNFLNELIAEETKDLKKSKTKVKKREKES